jgi:hypothetical protein
MCRRGWIVLAPDDRAVLLDLLRPPADMRMDVAVATTFTLDLEAALVAPLAFAAFDAAGPGDPIAALEAIRSVASRLTVFCQAGEMRVPRAASDLFAFLEPIVHEVRRPRAGHLFHPKLWLLRYRGDDDTEEIRLLVPTRNLTNDASWDAVLRLDGSPEGGPLASNRPLADLVRWCTANTLHTLDDARLDGINSLVESVRRTRWDLPTGVNDIEFHAIGVGGRNVPDFSGRRHLVISPFVNAAGLGAVAPSDRPIVVSRPDQLELLPSDTVHDLDCRWITSIDLDHDDASASPLGELHAKVVVVERAKRAHLFVGSANATGAAFSGNIEILVELAGGAAALGIDAVLADLGKVLEPCNITGGRQPSEADELRRALDDLLRDAALASLGITVDAEDDGSWSLDITSGDPLLPAGFAGRGTVELLSRPGIAVDVPAGHRLGGRFERVPLADITPFVVLRVELAGPTQTVADASVLRAQLLNDPAGRLDSVIARQVDSPTKFLRFLFLLLGLSGGGVPPWFQATFGATGEHDDQTAHRLVELGVFEALARALATNPAALDDLGRLIERLQATAEGRRTLPEGFGELWDAVSAARDSVTKARR